MVNKALIIPLKDLNESKKTFEGMKTVLVGGCFDILHYGHLQFLKSARESGDFLIVALESDEFIREKKNKEPIHTQDERAEILAAMKYVDAVIILPLFKSEKEYADLVGSISPKVIAVTEGDPYLENKREQAKRFGSEVKIVTPLIKGLSTRKIVSDIS